MSPHYRLTEQFWKIPQILSTALHLWVLIPGCLGKAEEALVSRALTQDGAWNSAQHGGVQPSAGGPGQLSRGEGGSWTLRAGQGISHSLQLL